LTDREKRELAHKKELLRLAKEHEKARELERIQRYHMPLENGNAQPEQDYLDKKPPQSEQSKWESDQMSSAVFKFGAKDKKG
jgi:pre-mRNA-splicing factor ATP-dependent RNA helicase DHX16